MKTSLKAYHEKMEKFVFYVIAIYNEKLQFMDRASN